MNKEKQKRIKQLQDLTNQVMKKSNFNLSDYGIDIDYNNCRYVSGRHYPNEKVREFIKLLKEFYKEWGSENELNRFLDKLAGEKLIIPQDTSNDVSIPQKAVQNDVCDNCGNCLEGCLCRKFKSRAVLLKGGIDSNKLAEELGYKKSKAVCGHKHIKPNCKLCHSMWKAGYDDGVKAKEVAD